MAGAAAWLAAFGVSMFAFGGGSTLIAYSQVKAAFLSVWVLYIIWAALLLFHVVDEAGSVAGGADNRQRARKHGCARQNYCRVQHGWPVGPGRSSGQSRSAIWAGDHGHCRSCRADLELVGMKRLSLRAKRAFVLFGLLAISFALYAGAESGAGDAQVALLSILVVLMVITIVVG